VAGVPLESLGRLNTRGNLVRFSDEGHDSGRALYGSGRDGVDRHHTGLAGQKVTFNDYSRWKEYHFRPRFLEKSVIVGQG
jgi:hypothetical protein